MPNKCRYCGGEHSWRGRCPYVLDAETNRLAAFLAGIFGDRFIDGAKRGYKWRGRIYL